MHPRLRFGLVSCRANLRTPFKAGFADYANDSCQRRYILSAVVTGFFLVSTIAWKLPNLMLQRFEREEFVIGASACAFWLSIPNALKTTYCDPSLAKVKELQAAWE